MDLFLQFILYLGKEDLERFINFLREWNNYPFFSSLYCIDDFNDDAIYFNSGYINFIERKHIINKIKKDRK